MCTPTKVLAVGDSIVAGDHLQWGQWDAWPARVDPWSCRWAAANRAVGGSGTADVAARLPGDLALVQPGEVWCLVGTNDLCHVHPDTICGRLAQMAQTAATAGARWRQATITPTAAAYPWRSCHEPDRVAVNVWIRSYFGPSVLDFDATLRAPNGTLDPAYDSGDRLHPNVLGHVRMADTARNVLAQP